MKFENIKVGDTVFTQKKVSYGWNLAEFFYISEKVTKVTKTQFTVESGDRYKKDGVKIGDIFYNAYYEGDEMGWNDKTIVCDETEKMKDFKLKLVLEGKLNRMAEKIKILQNSNLSTDELKQIIGKLTEVHNMII